MFFINLFNLYPYPTFTHSTHTSTPNTAQHIIIYVHHNKLSHFFMDLCYGMVNCFNKILIEPGPKLD